MPTTTASPTASVLPARHHSPAIDASGLVKTFGPLRALDGLDLKVETGQIHGFLGPNGSGKSTTIRVLLGMYRRDSGMVQVLGMDPHRDAEHITRRCTYVPGDVALWPTLTGAQTLDALAALRGASAVVAETLQDRVEAAGRALREGRRAVYLYWGDVDHVGHSRGFASPEWVAELEHLDAGMGLLARTLPKGTLLVVTADHGMVDVGERIDVSQEPGLAEGVELLAGEERALHVYTGDAARLAERWRGILGGRALVMTKDEALGTGVFGRAGRRAYEAMGDVVSFQASNLSVVDGSLRPPGGARMVGVHGSLTRQEMLVPLIVETV